MSAKLYLIPNTLGGDNPDEVIPAGVLSLIHELQYFIVENERNARRFLIKCGYNKPIDDIHFYILNKHTQTDEKKEYLKLCATGKDMGIITEAGLPGIADPGAEIVDMAHKKNIRVIPLTGPSSILLALIASGLNGQEFTFHGYLPVNSLERKNKIKDLELKVRKARTTQIFIETPYRNNSMFTSLLESCSPDTNLCIACDITLPTEFIKTLKVKEWKKERVDLHKRPSIFLLG